MVYQVAIGGNLHSDPFVFTSTYFSGWGKTIGGGSGAQVLQQAVLPVANHSACDEKMKVVRKVHKGPMLCAGGQGKGGCQVKNVDLLLI